jgi:hypothetical protein
LRSRNRYEKRSRRIGIKLFFKHMALELNPIKTKIRLQISPKRTRAVSLQLYFPVYRGELI